MPQRRGALIIPTRSAVAALCIGVFLFAAPFEAAAGGRQDSYAASLCAALRKVKKASKLSPTEQYEDAYNGFLKALNEADGYYRKIVERGPRPDEGVLLSIFDDYETAAAFWRAYMNDRVLVKSQDQTWEPTYLVDRDPWPALLEQRFPGLIAATRQKGENGWYITGDKALDYIFRQLGREVAALGC